jgi:hypothetical protein
MLQIFVEALALGAVLTITLVAGRHLGRRILAQRIGALPAGQGLRCVRRLELGEH